LVKEVHPKKIEHHYPISDDPDLALDNLIRIYRKFEKTTYFDQNSLIDLFQDLSEEKKVNLKDLYAFLDEILRLHFLITGEHFVYVLLKNNYKG